MSRPRLLDLFCKAGGCSIGYHRAGFDVVGVDIRPQPNYPFEFIQADALTFPLDGFDCVHGSPPCQFATDYGRRPDHVKASPNLIPATRARLRASGLPYVIENIEKARAHLIEPTRLCGTGFGLDVQRHRMFETSFPMLGVPCAHGRNGRRFAAATNRAPGSRRTIEIGVWRIPLAVQQRAMGIDWMTREELSQAIPPAYTEHIGHYLMRALSRPQAQPRASETPHAASFPQDAQ